MYSSVRGFHCPERILADGFIGLTLGSFFTIYRLFNRKGRIFRPPPGQLWKGNGLTNRLTWAIVSFRRRNRYLRAPLKRYGRWLFFFGFYDCLIGGVLGRDDILIPCLSSGLISVTRKVFRRRANKNLFKKTMNRQWPLRGLLNGKRASRRLFVFPSRVFQAFVHGFSFMAAIEVVIFFVLFLFPQENAKFFVDPFFNPRLNPVSMLERQSHILDREMQQYFGINPDALHVGLEENDEPPSGMPPPVENYLERRGKTSRYH